jgi:elongation factor 2
MGDITKLVSGKRGSLLDVEQGPGTVTIKAELPVQEMIGWSSDLRSATGGRGISNLMDQKFKPLPRELQENIIRKIRERKGLSENQ